MPSQLTKPSEVNIFFLLIKSFNISFCFLGTAPYYQDVKKRLMATLRQKGPPTCFTTLSSAEFDWDELGKDSFQKKKSCEFSLLVGEVIPNFFPCSKSTKSTLTYIFLRW